MHEEEGLDFDLLKKRLVDFEGLVLKPYHCSQNYLSIGVGRNLDSNGITEEEAMYLLDNDIHKVIEQLDKQWAVWRTFPDAAKYVSIDVAFNMGINTWMSFEKLELIWKWESGKKQVRSFLTANMQNRLGEEQSSIQNNLHHAKKNQRTAK